MIILQFLYMFAASLAFWVVLRWFTARSPLDNIPGPPPPSFWRGNMGQFMNRNGWEFHKHINQAYGGVVKLNGYFGSKQLYVFDPKALHHIVIKDQHIYEENKVRLATHRHLFGLGLLATTGDHHRKQRKILNPVFSTTHMRHMLPTFYGVASRLHDAIASKVEKGTTEIDMLHWMSRTSLELIGQSGLGYSFDSLVDDTINPYVKVIKEILPTLLILNAPSQLLPFVVKYTSAGFRKFAMNLLPWRTLHNIRDMSNLLHEMAREVVESKRSALVRGDEGVSEQIGRGKDLMSILLKANMEALEKDRLSEEELLGQVSTLIFAAMDTTTSALARTLHVLSEHPKEQEILRKEFISAHQTGGNLSYDELVGLPYLDAVCRETLRLYPPPVFLLRTTRKDVILPLSKPIRGVDGREISEIAVPNNTNIIIGIQGSNHNSDIWGEDALEWKPERWLSPLPDSVTDAHIPGVYSNMMTFLGGQSACIGFKFALLEMKVVLSLLLESFSLSPSITNEITWNMSWLVYPTAGDSTSTQLPIRVSMLAA